MLLASLSFFPFWSFTEESNDSQRKYNEVSKNDLNPLKKILHSQREDQDKKENTVRLDVNLMTMMTDFLAAKLKKETRTAIHLTNQLLEVMKTMSPFIQLVFYDGLWL